MEQHDSHPGCHLIKFIILILSSSPYANHVEIRPYTVFEDGLEFVEIVKTWIRQAWVQHVGRNVVCTLGIHLVTVDDDSKSIVGLIKPYSPNPIGHNFGIGNFLP